jgi:hypothetical protein
MQKSTTGIPAISGVQQSYESQLREKDEEISIMKEAFEQSILELDNSAVRVESIVRPTGKLNINY